MPVDVPAILQRHKALMSARVTWEEHWQRLAEVMLPRAADFTATHTPGDRRMKDIYDASAMETRRGLSASLDSMLKPKTSKWFTIKAVGDDIESDDEAREWLEAAEGVLREHIYARAARFVPASGEVDDELVTFGTGALFTGERSDKSGLSFRSVPLRNLCICENADGLIDTAMIALPYSVRQAAQRWGEDSLSPRLRERLKTRPDEVVKFIWCVQPRKVYDPERRDSKGLPFESVVVEPEGEHVVSESGYHEFPFAVPRWDTASGEIFGRSPAMIALPDVNTLQSMGKTLLKAGQLTVEPPLVAASEGIVGTVKMIPGGVTYVDYTAARMAGPQQPLYPLQVGANLPLGREMQMDTRQMVEKAFFRNVLGLPIDAPQMTATEVIERKQQFIRELGPVFGKLESDYIGAIVERSFAILLRGGAFGSPETFPEALQGREIRFEFHSPLVQALRKVEAAALTEAMTSMAPLVQVKPDMLDHLDTDEIMRAAPEAYGFPAKWLRTKDEVQQDREARAAAQQQMQQMQTMGAVAEMAGRAAPMAKVLAPNGSPEGALDALGS